MLTTAITAAIAVALSWLGIPPGPYLGGVWVGVKVLVVAAVALFGWRAARGRRQAAPPPAGG